MTKKKAMRKNKFFEEVRVDLLKGDKRRIARSPT